MNYHFVSTEIAERNRAETSRKLLGSWRLPEGEHGSPCLSFSSSGNFHWTLSTRSTYGKIWTLAVGSSLRGNWFIGSPRVTAYEVTGHKESGLIDTSGSSLAATQCLVLNLRAYPESILNVKLFGCRVDICDWLLNIMNLMSNEEHPLIDVTPQEINILYSGQRQRWLKV